MINRSGYGNRRFPKNACTFVYVYVNMYVCFTCGCAIFTLKFVLF